MKGKSLRRALSTDPLRLGAEIPLIVDTTELITPSIAKEMLQRNHHNRPIAWQMVEKYAEAMRRGEWRLFGQGIILDTNGNILTGQKRLWAVVKAGINVYMRVSRGNPSHAAHLIDRGASQTSRDLAARSTGRRHSPTEASIARAMSVLDGTLRPSVDDVALILASSADALNVALAVTRGGRKSKALLMILAALVHKYGTGLRDHCSSLPMFVDRLEAALAPRTAAECWGRGAAFSLAMTHALRVVSV